jgi:hypothetical protein
MARFNKITFTIDTYQEYQRFVKALAVASGNPKYTISDDDKLFAQKLYQATVKAHKNHGQSQFI